MNDKSISPEPWNTDEEDARIAQAVAEDPDTFFPDEAWMQSAKLVVPGKEVVTLRLDQDVLAWFRQDGRGYQTRINAVLRAFVEAQPR